MIRITKQTTNTKGLNRYEISIVVIGAMIVGLIVGFGIFGIQDVNGQLSNIDNYTQNVTSEIMKSEGYMIDSYVQMIKDQICIGLPTETEREDCFNI